MADESTARFDYENTLTVWKQYVDVRFKLLTLLPLATGIGVGVSVENLGARTAFVAAFVLVSIMWHDRALNIVYSSSFGAWATLLAASLADVFEGPASDDDRWLVAIVGGIASAVGAFYTIDRADDEANAIRHRMGK